jgi:hypothetical protein
MSDAASRLARSRQAIVEEFSQLSQREAEGQSAGWFARLGASARTWWRYHPVRVGLLLATPVLSKYAGRTPWRFLLVAAASGALFAITRPWRLLSVSLLFAMAKSSRISTLLLSVLAAFDVPRVKQRSK